MLANTGVHLGFMARNTIKNVKLTASRWTARLNRESAKVGHQEDKDDIVKVEEEEVKEEEHVDIELSNLHVT